MVKYKDSNPVAEWVFNKVMDGIEWVEDRVRCRMGSHRMTPHAVLPDTVVCDRPHCTRIRPLKPS